MKEKKTAIIIGAGISGIATSILLAKKGFNVSVYEKNSSPGGRCGQIIRDGHRFDLGATIFLMPSIYRRVFNTLGLDIEDSIELTKLDPIYKIFFDDGRELAFTTDDNRMQEQLETIEPGSFNKYKSYISKGYRLFNTSINKMLGKNYYNWFEFLNLPTILLVAKMKPHIRHYSYIKKFFTHPHLKMAFTFQNIYVGQSPYEAPCLFSMLPATELTEGALFPKGGMYGIVTKLLSIAEKLGVKFHYGSAVAKIRIEENEARGIILEGGKDINADVVVANADLPYIYHNLLPDKKAAIKLDRKNYSCSAIVFHWALDKVYPQLSHHSVFLSDGYETGMKKIFHEKIISDTPSFYVHAPVRTELSAAPENQDTLSIIIPAGHIDDMAQQDWNKLIQKARNAVINRLKKAGLTDIEEHIKFEICYPPKAWNNIYNISKGSVFGSIGHTIMQMGYFRPRNRHDKYQRLYFVGGSTHPGNGVPLVLLSAELTSERILKEIKL